MLTNQPTRWRKIADLEHALEAVIDGDLSTGLNMTWDAAERCAILMYDIYRAGQEPDVKIEFDALLKRVRKGRDPIEKLVRHELSNLPPKMKYKVMGVQSQIIAALHLIDREIGEQPIPSSHAIRVFLNAPTTEGGCGGLERCRLKWLHVIADETRKQRAAGGGGVEERPIKVRRLSQPQVPGGPVQGQKMTTTAVIRSWAEHVTLARQAIDLLRTGGKAEDVITLLSKIVND